MSLRLNIEDVENDNNSLDSTRHHQSSQSPMSLEAKEERRRVFWYLYSLDRHLALSSNRTLQIPDSMCEVYGKCSQPVIIPNHLNANNHTSSSS